MHRSFKPMLTTLILGATAGGLGLPLPGLGATSVLAQSAWGGFGSPYGRPYGYVRPGYSSQRVRVPRRSALAALNPGAPKKASAEEVAASKATASGPMIAVVSLASQRMTVYDATGPIIRSPISSGKAGHRTPTGVFSVIQKNRHHRSNIYSNAPMPYMQRVTWSGIALHAGVLPGYPASAGCVRLPYPVAAKLFAMSRMGMRVIIAAQEAAPGAFAHPALPEPLMVAAPPAGPERADAGSQVRVAAAGAESATDGQVATRFLNPMQAAVVERGRSRVRVVEATRANKDLLEASLRASAEANAASTALRAAQATVEQARVRAEAANSEARAALEQQLEAAQVALREAADAEALKSRTAYAAASASRDAEDALAAAEAAVKVADRGTEPIAVFISRREGKVFVRQGMTPLFDAPVTFQEPSRPLGTHVYQAMSADTTTGRIGWTAVTVPESLGYTESLDNRGPVRRGERSSPQTMGPPSDARGALERVVMSEKVRKKIAERLWLNGSIVISDHGLGTETGKGTDFIVQTQ